MTQALTRFALDSILKNNNPTALFPRKVVYEGRESGLTKAPFIKEVIAKVSSKCASA